MWCWQNAKSPQLSPRIGSHNSAAVRPAVSRCRQQQKDQLATIGSSMMQAFQPSAAACGAGAPDVTGGSQVVANAACGMRNTLLVAADSVTDAMSSLVKELNSAGNSFLNMSVIFVCFSPFCATKDTISASCIFHVFVCFFCLSVCNVASVICMVTFPLHYCQ